jgi:hypothetical protein
MMMFRETYNWAAGDAIVSAPPFSNGIVDRISDPGIVLLQIDFRFYVV